jgi:hypothetical protein
MGHAERDMQNRTGYSKRELLIFLATNYVSAFLRDSQPSHNITFVLFLKNFETPENRNAIFANSNSR